ncbi:MAG: lipase, partial [Myxococcota bacterium]|nr:lipase [Myxococcota bacterium]
MLLICFVFLWGLACVRLSDALHTGEEIFPSEVIDSDESDAFSDTAMEPEEHFFNWIVAHETYSEELLRTDIEGGFFGGNVSDGALLSRTPIVFVHGNSDRALGGTLGGWEALLDDFLSHGYSAGELYGTTYGPADVSQSSLYTHRYAYLHQVRSHMEAVLAYTGSEKIHVVAHSLGVTMARKAILGGTGIDDDGNVYDLGESLQDSISVFVGIAG